MVFLDTNVLIDADNFVRSVFRKEKLGEEIFWGVLCDFVEGEARNLRRGQDILEELKSQDYSGFYFETSYNEKEGSKRALEDMPNSEMAEAILTEYDKKLDQSGLLGITSKAKSATWSKSRYGDFSLLTVASLAAFRRKKQSVIVSRDRWIKLSCKTLEEKFRLPLYCYDQWDFSAEKIAVRACEDSG